MNRFVLDSGAIPTLGWRRIDAPVGMLEAACAFARQAIPAAAPVLAGREPPFFGQAVDTGAREPLVDAERREQSDQARKPYAAAVRRDGVAPDGDDQRPRLRRRGAELGADPARNTRIGAGAGGVRSHGRT